MKTKALYRSLEKSSKQILNAVSRSLPIHPFPSCLPIQKGDVKNCGWFTVSNSVNRKLPIFCFLSPKAPNQKHRKSLPTFAFLHSLTHDMHNVYITPRSPNLDSSY
uniref:Uncharacterized protein n=1 Tax=Sphaerodactylus townsendi TaxID=933632 RepID=A0ACB8ENY2_9SAUR